MVILSVTLKHECGSKLLNWPIDCRKGLAASSTAQISTFMN